MLGTAMTEMPPNDETEADAGPGDAESGEPGGAVTGALAERARQMLGRDRPPSRRIVEAATGGEPQPTDPKPEAVDPGASVPPPSATARRHLLEGAAGLVGGVRGAIRDAAGDRDEAADHLGATTSAGAAVPAGAVPGRPGSAGGGVAPPSGGGGGDAGGTGGGGGRGGRGDDEVPLFPGLPGAAADQVLWLGLLVAALLLFGASIWSALYGEDDPASDVLDATAQEIDPTDLEPATAVLAGRSTDGSDEESGVESDTDDGGATTSTSVEDSRSTVTSTAAAPATTEAAAATTETTVTTEATGTSGAAAASTSAQATEAFTLWNALNESGLAGQFATFGGAIGLESSLDDLNTDRTLFAPSDAAIAALDSSALNTAASDPDGAGAGLIGYHLVDQRLLIEDLVGLDGQPVATLADLPVGISIVDGEVVLNGSSRIVAGDLIADNGVVHIVDTVLTPPTVNEVLGLENIEFEVNSAVITAAGQAELLKAVEFFAANPTLEASIEGHTDTDGPEVQNLILSEERAESVKTFLVENGLDGDRFTTVGFGETRPVIVDGVEDKVASRRIEFVVG